MSSTKFKEIVWSHYRLHGRHDLPWRKTRDPYRILVSEIMLQQTQVERVRVFYARFIKRFPTVEALVKAPLGEVIRAWQGLGYNRRAKALHAAAKNVVSEYSGRFPRTSTELQKLPGVGPYTAGAIAAFAFNEDAIFVETNIRTAILQHFFPKRRKVSDAEIIHILEKLLPPGKSREWNLALMDYGAYLKKSGIRVNTKSRHYIKQSKFSGSPREARGAILKELSKGTAREARLLGLLGDDRIFQMRQALSALASEGLITKRGKAYHLAF